MTLDVAISTYRPEGIKRVEKMLPQPQEGVRYVVSWQEHEDTPIPESLMIRDDVDVYRLELKGLSNNRNNAINHCKGDIILVADDDLVYYPGFAEKIKEAYQRYPTMDLATFKFDYLNKKIYPPKDCKLKLPFPKNYYLSSVELTFRREKLKDLKFKKELGLGNKWLGCGEDEFFLIEAIKEGYDCRFVNETIGIHPLESTGDKVCPGILRGQGYVIRKIYPYSGILRIALKAKRLGKVTGGNFIKILYHLFQGFVTR